MTAVRGARPFAWRSAAEGWRRLYDLAALAGAVDLRPLDRVLDLGSGFGGASAMLRQMGCRVLSVDPAPDRLLAGRRDGRALCDDDPAAPDASASEIAALAEALPLNDGAVDVVLGLHVLHHVEHRSVALAEIHRVLRPGGMAAFAEPGRHHGGSREALLEARRFGEREQDFHLDAFVEEAIACGFARAVVLPLPYPAQAGLPYEGEAELRRRWMKERGPGWASWLVHDVRPLVLLEKAGARRIDSRWREVLVGSLSLDGWRREEGFLRCEVVVENRSDRAWRKDDPPTVGTVRVGWRFFEEGGRQAGVGEGRADLPAPLGAGERARLTLSVPRPDDLRMLRLRIELVSEFVAWFGDLEDGEDGVIELDVPAA